eukprot:m.225666 g.225666  ORF g.225666 m.225666 type:complete len:62 (+) comp40016_c0_seq41:981-1166(+)
MMGQRLNGTSTLVSAFAGHCDAMLPKHRYCEQSFKCYMYGWQRAMCSIQWVLVCTFSQPLV